ncbi:MAG: FtsW/RodA/SpoVE family cell cycle protein [Candidatus Cryptobacteroides sp.]
MDTATENKKQGSKFWNFIDNIEGDKVVWIVVLMLILISVLAIFSSTSLLDDNGKDRLDIIREQLIIVGAGLGLIWILYKLDKLKINSIKLFMNLSQFGFLFSFILLLILDLHLNLGFIKAQRINEAWRTLSVKGLQIHVFEFTKVAMVMYVAWACHSYKKDQEMIRSGEKSTALRIANALAQTKYFAFMGKPFWKRVLYMYMPVGIICIMVLMGSGSSALFIGAILLSVLFIGGIPFKEVLIGGVVALMFLAGGIAINQASDGKALKIFERLTTMFNRMTAKYDTERLKTYTIGSSEFYTARDSILQPFGAKIAVHEGGVTGKMSGNSTQKYVVTNMYGDYMFSFIIEEYGLAGAIIVLILYVSLMARGSIIARMCTKEFTKLAVGGLTLLITGQAFMHMLVNVDIGPMTGQTLPLVSHGAFAFIMFCIAFGIILSISKMTRNQMKQAEAQAQPIYEREKDDIQASMDILDRLDSGEIDDLDEEDL